MNEEYTEISQAFSVGKFSVLQHQLTQTLSDNNFESASIRLIDSSFDNVIPSEIRFGCESEPHSNFVSYPILYRKRKLGDLRLQERQVSDPRNREVPALAKRIALILKRFQATELKSHYIGKELCLAGYSEHLLELEHFIEKAASANCPVIIGGPMGSESLAVASAIHCNSSVSEQPFVEIRCVSGNDRTFQMQIMRGVRRAQGGSIFINSIDELSLEQQNILTELMSSQIQAKGENRLRASASNVRILVSTSKPLEGLVASRLFSRRLYSELNFLQVWLPPLAQRKEDIPSIVEKLLSKYCHPQIRSLTPEAMTLLQNYHWPENYEELERVIARISTFAEEATIDVSDVVDFAPEVVDFKSLAPSFAENIRQNFEGLVDILLKQEFEVLQGFHPSLNKALVFLAENYCQEITLSSLSSNAFISPSHLSFLFKSTLGTSFKPLLAAMRIERAKSILQERPNARITDVSLEVGFGDLSHFEKIFKRLTGMTPRDYKNHWKKRY
ncbi:AraC family transcriptional regulator [Alteromonas sp. a30]|uniref:AraC family transcriptional regulator n=1 Tax=Alteromonas sp. a30 TaxID=2730917 RepID=UPI002280EE26|nr:AraC family transcriptional regulator [Alteromonas sp. a30]MCY7296855.1 helix-turn-helix domain-containing protein [Alteromonas sp. a30]